MYLWFKLLHIFFIIAWFAGLFYLPRIYVNLAQVDAHDSAEYQRLLGMAERLFKFSTPWAIGSVVCGVFFAFVVGWWQQGWVHSKLLLGVALLAYHFYCYRLLQDFRHHQNRFSHLMRLSLQFYLILLSHHLYIPHNSCCHHNVHR